MIARRFFTVVVAAAFALVAGVAAARDIALSFDDGFDPREQPRAAAWDAAILDALACAEVRAILFPAGRRVDNPEGMALVAAWSDRGHDTGNHTYSHRSLESETTTVDAFTADVERDERLLEGLPGFTRRLRFPYLKEGGTADRRDAVRDRLAAHDYRPGGVTIDTSDWYDDARFRAWRAAHPDAQSDTAVAPFRRAYLAHLAGRVAYYDDLARRVLHRDVAHGMLLHTNAIDAAFLPDVIEMLRADGWTIVPPVVAFDDPIHERRFATLPAGESLVWAAAKEASVARSRWPAEDDAYEKPIVDALGL